MWGRHAAGSCPGRSCDGTSFLSPRAADCVPPRYDRPHVFVHLACEVGQGEDRPRRIKVSPASVSVMHRFVSDDIPQPLPYDFSYKT
jgi:hypothetical protein